MSLRSRLRRLSELGRASLSAEEIQAASAAWRTAGVVPADRELRELIHDIQASLLMMRASVEGPPGSDNGLEAGLAALDLAFGRLP